MKTISPRDIYARVGAAFTRIEALERAKAAGLFEIKVLSDTSTLTVGAGQFIFMISEDLNGFRLISAHAYITTVSSAGTPTIQVRNVTAAVNMLSTRITIDATEKNSYTAAVLPVISTANAGVSTGDEIAIDVDVAGTGAKGLGVILEFGR